MAKYLDKMNRFRTQSLFLESYIPEDRNELEPIFTLKNQDHGGLPSMKRLYLEYEDPTGYQFAIDHLDSYPHWTKLCRSTFFKKHKAAWDEELEVRLLSKSIRKVNSLAQGDTAQAFNAAKYLADKGWEPKKGRPTKASIEAEKKKQAALEEDLVDDLERIQLRVVK